MFKKTIRNWLDRRLHIPRIDFALERLKACGFTPDTIFDVGAYQGDFAQTALRVWPNCDIVCFEVQTIPLDRLRSNLSSQHVRVIECLLGAERRFDVTLHLAETASSVLVENAHPLTQAEQFQMRTIDETEFNGRSPALLKLDVQGYELEILTGAEKTLPQIRVVLAEVNLLDIHKDVPLLHELVEWFAKRNWVAFDICGLARRPLDQALWQADFVFVPIDGPLRLDKRWS
jgi:FkbM family methyltransferase